MTKYNRYLHTHESTKINTSSTLDDLIASLQEAKIDILGKHPDAFQIEVDARDDTLIVSYFRNKTQQELDNIKAYQERQSKVEYQTYLDLKRKFEGN